MSRLGSLDYERGLGPSVFIDLDYTITEERSIEVIGRELGLYREIIEILDSSSPEYIKSSRIASLLRGLHIDRIREIVSQKTSLKRGVDRLIRYMMERGFRIYVVTLTYKQIAETVIEKLSRILETAVPIRIYAPVLEVDERGLITGRVILEESSIRLKTPFCIECSLCKRYVVRRHGGGPVVSIGDARPDACMFIDSHIAIAVRSPSNRHVVRLNSDIVVSDFSDLDYIARLLRNIALL